MTPDVQAEQARRGVQKNGASTSAPDNRVHPDVANPEVLDPQQAEDHGASEPELRLQLQCADLHLRYNLLKRI